MKSKVIGRFLTMVMCWVPWCSSMEPNASKMPLSFHLVEMSYEMLNLDKPEAAKNTGLEELKKLLMEENCYEKYEDYTLFLYLLHHFGSQEKLVRAVSDVLINVPEQQAGEEDAAYNQRISQMFYSFVNARTPDLRRTALHYAAGYGYWWLVKKLIAIGADIKDVDCNNANALHYAAGCDKSLLSVEAIKCQNLGCCMVPIEHSGDCCEAQIPKFLIKGLLFFEAAIQRSPWMPWQFSCAQENDSNNDINKAYIMNIAHRAFIIDLLIKNMLFHSFQDKFGKSPHRYAQESGHVLLIYVLTHQYPEPSSTDKFFHYGIAAWGAIFGVMDQLVSL